MSAPKRFRVFVSAVTSEFESARGSIASDLRARGLEVKVQPDFRQEALAATTLQKLHDYIRDCSAVVCLLGRRSGGIPPAAATERYVDLLPEGITEASFTQWEVLFARHHGKRVSLYLSSDDFVPDREEVPEAVRPDLQTAFVAYLKAQGLDRDSFSSTDEVCRLVLRETWPRIAVRKPNTLPYMSLRGLFKGRDEFLKTLRKSLLATADGDATAIVGKAIHGLGGVGKTRLAVEYAHAYAADYSALLFVVAESPVDLRRNLAELVAPSALDLPQRNVPEEEVREAAVVDWLCENHGWLLILDNIDTPEAATAAQSLLARVRGGHVLLTGRLAKWRAGVRLLELGVLDLPNAARYLIDRTEPESGTAGPGRRRCDADPADAEELAKELGCLALALEQAAAHVAHRRIGLGEYLRLWREHLPRVQAWHDADVMDYPRSVAVTWQTTLDQLDSGAVALLRILAWFAPEPIPLFVFEGDEAKKLWREIGVATEHADVFDALATLAAYSMIRWETEEQTVTVHRVVQEILRTREPDVEHHPWLRHALHLLALACPGSAQDVRTWDKWDPLQPHVAFAARCGDKAGITDPTSFLMNELGQLLDAKALYIDAERMMRRALSIDESSYGSDHPEVARDLNNLAALLQATNRLAEAEPLMRRMVRIFISFTRTTGHQHPHLQAALGNYEGLLPAMGRTQAEIEESLRSLFEEDS